MAALKALVFDMDDTLYPEEAYVRSGFRAVARWFADQGPAPQEETFAALWAAHRRGPRGRIFDAFLAARPERVSVASMVKVYRSHAPDIRLYPGMAGLLDEARARGLRIAVLSDGFLEAQQLKVRALALARWAEPILLTDALGRAFWKPDPRAFTQVQGALGVGGGAIAYVGDNPVKDFQAPAALGWQSIHLAMPGQVQGGRGLASARWRVEGVRALREKILDLLG